MVLPLCLRVLAFVLAEGMLARGSGKFLLTDEFDYELPDGLVATQPTLHRDASRLLILSKDDGGRNHCFFSDLPRYLRSRSLLVLNDTRVIPARLSAQKPTGGRVEVFLVEQVVGAGNGQAAKGGVGTWVEDWRVLMRGLGHCPVGTRLAFACWRDRSSRSCHFSRMKTLDLIAASRKIPRSSADRLSQAFRDITSTSGLIVCSVRV